MKVLFIGGTGTISLETSKLCVNKNIELYLLNRGNRNEYLPKDVNVIKGDINDRAKIKKRLKNEKFDVIVDWIVYNKQQAKADIELFKDKCKQFIFISSASAYKKPVLEYMISEDTTLKNPYWDYSRKKIECENIFMDAYREIDFPVTIVRPSHTYDEKTIPFLFNSKKSRYSIVKRIIEGKKIIIPGDGTNFWVLTHSRDFAKGFIGLFMKSQAIGEEYNIVSDEILTWNEIADTIGRTFNKKVKKCYISTQSIIECMPKLEGELLGDKINNTIIDNSKIKKLVSDFKPTTSFSDGMEIIKKWYDEHPSKKELDEDWDNTCDKLVNAQKKISEYFFNN